MLYTSVSQHVVRERNLAFIEKKTGIIINIEYYLVNRISTGFINIDGAEAFIIRFS